MTVSVAAVIVNFNGGDDLARCLASVLDDVDEVVIVDNGSTDVSLDGVPVEPRVRIVRSPTNDGFGGGGNRGAGVTTADVLLFLNPDVVMAAGAVRALSAAVEVEGGVAAPILDVTAGGAPDFGARLDLLGTPESRSTEGPVFYVHGAALAIARTTFEAVGGFDARYFLTYEDVELCWRVWRRGEPVRVLPDARATHRGGQSLPGGYLRDGKRTTSSLRLVLRERNTLTAFLSCAPLWWLFPFLLGHVVKIGVIALVLRLSHRNEDARALVDGLAWNVRQLAMTVRRRRSLAVAGHAPLRGRVMVTPVALRQVVRHGLPVFVETKR